MLNIKTKLRRAFTIVELVVVIAVIAALAAILIPTFANVINAANESSDVSMIYNINLALATEQNNINTVSDALEVAAEAGYNIDKLTPSSDGEIVYDGATKSFALISTDKEVIYPTSNADLDLDAPTTYYFVDEAAYTALNTTASVSASSYSTVKSVKTATSDTNSTDPVEHTVSYIAKGEWTGGFSYTGMGAIDTTRATGITSISYTSKTISNNKNYKLNVAYYIGESSADNYSLTVSITESVDTIYTSVASNVIYNISVAANSTVNIVEANENAAPMLYQATENVTLTISINGTDVTEDYVVEKNENAVVENGVLQLGTEKYPYLVSTLTALNERIASDCYVKLTKDIECSTVIAINNNVTIDLNGHTISAAYGSTCNTITVGYSDSDASLTIKDSSGGNGSIVNSATNIYSAIATKGTLILESGTIEANYRGINLQNGTVTINGGTVKVSDNSTSTEDANAIYLAGVTGCTGLVLNINGGNIVGGTYYNSGTTKSAAIATSNAYVSTINISGGNISGKYGIYFNAKTAVAASSLTMTGGSIKTTNVGITVVACGTVTIQGGEIYGRTSGIILSTGASTSIVIINGGTITGDTYAIQIDCTTNNVTINGGTIKGEVNG